MSSPRRPDPSQTLTFPSLDASPTAQVRVPMPRSGSMAVSPPIPMPRQEGPTTRTVAVLTKSAAKVHRLAIESRIIQAGFDIIAERAERWNSPDDDDFLHYFLYTDAAPDSDTADFSTWACRLTNGPIHVLVLERANAVETWLELLGPESDTETDNDDHHNLQIRDDGLPISKKGLRQTYGVDSFYGSPNDLVAQDQIAVCFPELDSDHNGQDSYHQSAAHASQQEVQANDANVAVAQSQDPTTFRARPLPDSLKRASIQPRLSKAAALRMGIKLPDPPRRNPSETSSASGGSTKGVEGPVGISGLPKAQVQLPASLRPPTVAPRLNKAAAARTKSDVTFSPAAASKVREKKQVDYSNTPGHKRSTSIQVASTAAPTIAPRQTRASMSRITAHTGSPAPSGQNATTPGRGNRTTSITSVETNSSAGSGERERRPVDYSSTPGHKRNSLSLNIPSLAKPSMAPRANRASLARTGGAEQAVSPSPEKEKENHHKQDPYVNTPGHKRRSMTFNLASLQAPTIVPRSNNAANARIAAGTPVRDRPSSALGKTETPPPSAARRNAPPPSAYRSPAMPPRPQSVSRV